LRHFSDKRDVLFRGSGELQQLIVDAVDVAPLSATPIEAITLGLTAAGASFDAPRRPYSLQRPVGNRREPRAAGARARQARLAWGGARRALRQRGVKDPAAALTPEAGVAAFRVASERWVRDDSDRDFARFMHEGIAELRTVAAG
jgi:hypothetical protein